MDKINIIKDRIDFLIKTNSTDKEIFNLFKDLFILVPYDIDYLMLYSRFLGRTCYGRWKDKKFLKESENILYKVLKIHNIINIDNKSLTFGLYQVYAWLGMIYGYYGDTNKAFLFYSKSRKFILNEEDELKLDEWICGSLINLNKFNKVLEILLLYNIDKLRIRSIGYLCISFYNIGDINNFEVYSKIFIKNFIYENNYFFIENINKLSVIIISLSYKNLLNNNLFISEIEGRVKKLSKNLNIEYFIFDNLEELILGLKKSINNGGEFYGIEKFNKLLRIYLQKYNN